MARPRRPAPPPFNPAPPPAGEGEAQWIGRRIPRPPSMNGLYRNNKEIDFSKLPKPEKADPNRFPGGLIPTKQPPKRLGGRVRTSRYDGWCGAAGWEIRTQGPLPVIKGAYELVILLGRRKGSDLDNYAKGLCDYLKKLGVIEDDSLCEDLRIRWHDALNAKQAYFFIRAATVQPARVQSEGLARAS